jgi:aromatic-L-amino-acid/L-tryptophan decarboxylase
VRSSRSDDVEERANCAALFPDLGDRARTEDVLSRMLAAADRIVRAGPVTPCFDEARFGRDLESITFEAAIPFEELLEWTIAQLEVGLVHVNHPRYFGLFNPAPTFPSQCADRITALFNPQLASATTSPVGVAIESHVMRHIAERAGLPPGASGHFTTGGTEANFTALICALSRAAPDFAANGTRAFSGAPTCYVSADSHLAWIKIAHQAGIGRDGMRMITTDGLGRLDARVLAAAVAADLDAGRIPVMVAATAGTTNAGMIDPLHECAAIAANHRLWYHVDAAWGGAIIATDRGHEVLAGLRAADSVTIDAHKWFATTMGCGMFLTPHLSVLSDAFQVETTFMPSNARSVDPYVTTVQWSRRFLGLRMFLSLAAAGWPGYAAHVERAIHLIDLLRERLSARGWRIANASPLAVLCVEPPTSGRDARSVVGAVVESGRAWISAARFEGRDVVRICVTNGETSPDDIDALVESLCAAL